jgi:endonuclease YncB( thermonuclease family)
VLRLGLAGVAAAMLAEWWHDDGRRGIGGDAFEAPAIGSLRGRARVGDGDGLTIGDTRMRLVGIDAPELAQDCRIDGRRVACGIVARDRLIGLIAGRPVDCDWGRLDRWGRALARCRAGGTDLGAAMVRDGWAVAYGGHEAEEAEARAARRGLWAGTFEWPEEWRRAHPSHAGRHDGEGER